MDATVRAIAKTTAQQRIRTQRGAEVAGSKKAAGEKGSGFVKGGSKGSGTYSWKGAIGAGKGRYGKGDEAHSAWASWATSVVAPWHGEDRNNI